MQIYAAKKTFVSCCSASLFTDLSQCPVALLTTNPLLRHHHGWGGLSTRGRARRGREGWGRDSRGLYLETDLCSFLGSIHFCIRYQHFTVNMYMNKCISSAHWLLQRSEQELGFYHGVGGPKLHFQGSVDGQKVKEAAFLPYFPLDFHSHSAT